MPQTDNATKRDYYFAVAAGLLIGLLAMPVMRASKGELYAKIGMYLVPFFTIGSPLGLYVAKIISRKILVFWQIAKFALIGVLNTLVDLGTLALMTFAFRKFYEIDSQSVFYVGPFAIMVYSVYKAISFIIANVNSYVWNKYWTFEDKAPKKSRAEFIQFFIVSFVGFLINLFVANYVFQIFSQGLGLDSDQLGQLGGAAGSIAGLIWNFFGYKFIVFKK